MPITTAKVGRSNSRHRLSRSLFATGLAIAACMIGSPCPEEIRCRDSLASDGRGTAEHRAAYGRNGGCAGLTELEYQGKRVCASPPVDFERVSKTKILAAPRVAPIPLAAGSFELHSRPGATKIIYLDFDGHVTRSTPWNKNGNQIVTTAYDIDSNPGSFSATEQANILEIWQRVSECFSPFDVDVTTQAPAVADLINTGGGDVRWGVRVLFGDTNPSPAPGSGGVAYVDAFGWNYGAGNDVPCFVFQDGVGASPKFNADAAVHEVGHVLGLDHDGQRAAGGASGTEYYEGQGSGKIAWAPHMGASYYVPLVQWSKGEYANANNTEDDLNMIATLNGFGFRPDDFGSMASLSQAIPGIPGGSSFSINVSGVIETRTDIDWFKIVAAPGTLRIDAVGGPANTMLDIHLTLYSSNATVIATSNPLDDVIASINQTLPADTYYLRVDGVGYGNPQTTGYTDYGSLGQYTLTGSYATAGSQGGAPILSGNSNQFYGVKQLSKIVNLGITVTDPNSPTLSSATVRITNVVPSQDSLAAHLQAATTGNISGSYNSTTGILTLTSAGRTATVEQFQAALRTVAYSNSSGNPSLTPRTVQFQVSDGTLSSNISTTTVALGYFYVAANYDSASRTLTLGDDVGDNTISISLSGSQLTVEGSGPTRIGTAASSETAVTFTVGTDVKIVGNFSGGSDAISLTGVKSSDAAFTLGNGNDSLKLTLCNIGQLTVDGGNGTDSVTSLATVLSSRNYTGIP